MNRFSQPLFGLLALGLLTAAGCGPKTLPQKTLIPVKGRVMVNGQPARFVSVELKPEDPASGVPAVGKTDGDGVLEFRTYANDTMDGAVAGKYKAVVGNWDGTLWGELPKGSEPTTFPSTAPTMETTVEIAGDDEVIIQVP